MKEQVTESVVPESSSQIKFLLVLSKDVTTENVLRFFFQLYLFQFKQSAFI